MRLLSTLFVVALLVRFSTGQVPVESGSNYAAALAIWLGQAAPGTEGGRFAGFGNVVINNRGDMAFGAWITGGKSTSGVFLLTHGEVFKIALSIDSSHGETAPGTDGGVFASYFLNEPVALNNLGQVAFPSTIAGGSKDLFYGIFLFDGATLVNTVMYPPHPPTFGPAYPDWIYSVSLNDRGEIAFLRGEGVYLFSGKEVVPIATLGQSAPGTSGSFLSIFDHVSINNAGQIAFLASAGMTSGVFLYSAGNILPVVLTGQSVPVPAGERFDFFDFRGPSDAGEVLFSGNRVIIPAGLFRQEQDVRFGLYLFSMGEIVPIAVMGQKVPDLGSDAAIGPISGYALSPSGNITFTAWTNGLSQPHYSTYAVSQGTFKPVSFFLDGNPPANAAQPPDGPLALNDEGMMLLSSFVPPQLWGQRSVFLLATPFNSGFIPADDFETLGDNGLPSGWATVWSNSGSGGAWQYNSNGDNSFSGLSVLRVHVGAGGGATFVLSDPIPVVPDKTYGMSVQMRYALPSDSDAVAFTVLQYDAAGYEIGINELDGIAADNRWTWKEKAMFVHTKPDTRSVRVRFGLISTQEAYIDIDTLH